MAVKHYKIKNGDKTTHILTADDDIKKAVDDMLKNRKKSQKDGVIEVDDYEMAMKECINKDKLTINKEK